MRRGRLKQSAFQTSAAAASGSASPEGKCERFLERGLTLDPADVADDPAQPTAQDAQLPLMPLELFGMGIAAGHHRGELGA